MAPTALLNIFDHLSSKLVLDAFEDQIPKSEIDGVLSKEEFEFLDKAKKIKPDEYIEALDSASRLNNNKMFETFNSVHMDYAEPLIDVLYKIDVDLLNEAVAVAKKYINVSLLNYVICVILRHRSDAMSANVQVPSHVCTNPEMYFDMSKINEKLQVQQQVASKTGTSPSGSSTAKKAVFIDVNPDFTASDLDPEHRVAYFREDIGINLHHRHWHEVYPHTGNKEIVNKDRRGELFYYMHQQVVARYNFERFCNNLPRAKAFSDFRVPIDEAYYPKLDIDSKTKIWCPRQAYATLSDLYRDAKHRKITDLEHWRDRLYDVVDSGYAYVRNEDGTRTMKKLVEPEAINELGNTIEACNSLSWDFQYYGDMHNSGHLFISYCHDPDYRFREVGSVMSHSESALRDPMFYRWHVFVDDIFQQYKGTLPPYTVAEREFPGIEVTNIEVNTAKESEVSEKNEPNVFNTFWQRDTVDISEGILNIDPSTSGSVYATFTHLNHEDFTYKITVNNKNNVEKTGTVRIFYGPKYDESKSQLMFNSQRKLLIELDKFTATLKVGANTIERKSTSSSVTIPFQQSFMTVNEAKQFSQTDKISSDLSYCGCGWPQHLLIGKGSATGFSCVLFVMITDYENDKVEGGSLETECCIKSAVSFCGIRDKKYPDKRAMGFPFDRNVSDDNATLADFMTKSQKPSTNRGSVVIPQENSISNMKVIDVKVKFFEKTKDGLSIERVQNTVTSGTDGTSV